MRIRMHAAGLHIREVLKQCVQNEGRLIGSTGDEATEQRNVVVRNMAVSDTTGLAVTDVMLGKQIVFVRFKVGAIGGGGFSRPPLLRQLKLGIQIDQISRG